MKKYLIFGIFIFIACSEKPDLEKLSKIYVDLKLAEEKLSADSLKYELAQDSIFGEYSFNAKKYESELKKIGSKEETWKEFFELSLAYLDTLQREDSLKGELFTGE